MAGNKNSGRRPGGKDFSPRVRGLFDIAIKELLASGKLLPKLKEQLLADPSGTIQRMAAYAPKQYDVNLDQRITLDATDVSADDWSIVAEVRKQLSEPGVTH